jgi:beta-lactamase regulating signal transducer with metallopeptidase domain
MQGSLAEFAVSFGPLMPSETTVFRTLESFLEANLVYIVWIWMAGMVGHLIRFSAGVMGIHRVRRSVSTISGLDDLLDKLTSFYGIRRKVVIGESMKARVPMMIGYLKPMIVLPLGYASGIPADQLELVLAHELAHIKRGDYLVNVIVQLIKTVYFYHPVAHWMSRKIEVERECACDDMVLQLKQPVKYAQALLAAHDWESSLSMRLGGQKNDLGNRINRIMKRNMKKKQNVQPWTFVVLVMLMVTVVWADNRKSTNIAMPIKTASMFHEPAVTPVGPTIETAWPRQDTVPEPGKRESTYAFDLDMDFEEALSLQLDEFVLDLEDIVIPDIEIPPFPDFQFDTIIPVETIQQLEMAREKMEMLQMKEMKELYNSQEFKQQMQEQAMLAEKLQKEILESIEKMELDKIELEYLEQIEGLEELNEVVARQMREVEEQLSMMPDMEEEMKKMEQVIKEETKHLREFEYDMKEALLEDGYWEEGEKLNIKFSDDWMEVNGERVEGKKFKKY